MIIDSKTAVVQGILGFICLCGIGDSELSVVSGVIGEHCWHFMSF